MGAAAGVFEESPLVFHAAGLAEWHYAHRFCPRCAAPLVPRAAGHELVCTDCGKVQFPSTDPAVITARLEATRRLAMMDAAELRANGAA